MTQSEENRPYDPYRKERVDPGEEIVISGISGKYPESDSIQELRDNLMNKVDMITQDDRRWKLDHPEIPQRLGKLKNLSKFDAEYFGIHFKDAHTMDPMGRISLELTHEALIDAGVNPKNLRGTNTGVFFGGCSSESQIPWIYEKNNVNTNGSGLTGCNRSMLANRISHWLGITGPSYSIDSACSSSLFAMEQGYRAVRTGICDSAIVGATSLCLHPNVSLHFAHLGVLSPDGRSKSFDNHANGYVRGETISVVYLQRAKHAKRVYATVVHAKTNCDGFKPQGITFPSTTMQALLLRDVYRECQIPPSSVTYVEAHGTGTKVGDPEELNAIDSIFCPGRKGPLLIGSVKSNMGHAEPASGMGQISKVVIAFEDGIIPPTLHYQSPREEIKALADGRLKVVTEPTPWEPGYVGISSFGFGGANAHILLRPNTKKKVNGGAPRDDLPRLVVVSGRTEEAVHSLLRDVESRPVDVEYIRLLQEAHAENILHHNYRGYTIVNTSDKKTRIRDVKYYPEKKRPVWFVLSGVGSEWPSMGTSLLRFPVFADAVKRCDVVLKNYGIDIYDVLTNSNKSVFDDIVNSSVGIATVQIGLVDLLTSLRIVPDGIIGYSVGELVCAYADGCLTAEQVILATYYRSIAIKECDKVGGSLAIVGVSYRDIKNLCPTGVEVVCHNSDKSSTVSGPVESVRAFVAELITNNILAEEIVCSGIAYRTSHIADVGPELHAHLKKVISAPEARSSKWYSTSVPRSHWNSPQAKLSSAEYYINNVPSPVLFEEATALIPKNAITIEIAPRGILQQILTVSLNRQTTNVALIENSQRDNIESFLQTIGHLYEIGLQPAVWNLYPEVQFPVSRRTPMISPLIKWDHSENWYVAWYRNYKKINSGERLVEVSLSDQNHEYMAGHVIDGKNLLPATGYLFFVWETVGMMRGILYSEVSIVFEDVKFLRATTLSKKTDVNITVMIHKGSGKFEVVEGDVAVVSGTVRFTSNPQEEQITFPIPSTDEPETMTSKDIYKEFRLRGYQYSGLFRALKSATTDGSKGTIRWTNNWVAFMDNMLQIQLLGLDSRSLLVPTGIRKLTINGKKHSQMIRAMLQDEQDSEFKVYVNRKHNVIQSGGIQIRGVQASGIGRRRPAGEPVLETCKFVAHRDQEEISLKNAVRIATHIALENHLGIKVKTLEFLANGEKYPHEEFISHHILKALADLPMMKADVNIVLPENHLKIEDIPEGASLMEMKKVSAETNPLILAGRNLLSSYTSESVDRLFLAVKDGSFVISIESRPVETLSTILKKYSLYVILEKLIDGSNLLLLRKVQKVPKNTDVIHVSNDDLAWIGVLQAMLKKETERQVSGSSRIILVSDKTFENGLLGLTNCLRKEPGGEVIHGVLIQDTQAPDFSLTLPLYADQLRLDLAINVLREDATWGSYRHLPLPAPIPLPMYHVWANQLVRGDLSSFRWMEGSVTPDTKDLDLIRVAYSAINFRDIMFATGKLASEIIVVKRTVSDCILGLEYSGITTSGRRVMGMKGCRAFTNLLESDSVVTWTVPDSWSLAEAASVPVAYATCFYALYMTGNMKKGDKVLIHTGSGGVGQAAINLALWAGCEVFTTVGTTDKMLFIRKTFPQIPEDHIGNSRDTSFEQMIMNKTNGRGVDIVLNSLAEDKLQASVRCLAGGGRFLEIGKFDMANNSILGMSAFMKEISFHGILMDKLVDGKEEQKRHLQKLMQRALDEGAIKPLNVTIYPRDQIEPAFRFMAAGKHIGKVILKIQDEDKLGEPIPACPRYHCLKDKSYVILGGLGGFGLELADWLVLRGAQYIILTSRSGIKNGYQQMRVKLWESYGVKVTIVSGKEASNLRDCEDILSIAAKQAPIDAIYNLAVVLKDSIFENQTSETFEESFKSKAWATKNLDKLSRKMCPELRHFVVFSSVSCGRGNAGQTNYGMSNSVMERICERRAAEGLPALAVQWGAVGDVGLVADMQDEDKELVIGGTLQQRISSCLHELDGFLNQKSPIVASMVVAEKRAGGSGSLNIVDTVLNIMSFKNLKSVSQHTPLAELGMDSMMAVEIKQTLEREFDIFLTAQDIRGLNFAKLTEMNIQSAEEPMEVKAAIQEEKEVPIMDFLVKVLEDDETLMQEQFIKLPTKTEREREEIFLIPGIEGFGNAFKTIAPLINSPATCLQLDNNDTRYLSIPEMAEKLLSYVLSKNRNQKEFLIIGYSFGSVIAIELVRKLESQNRKCNLILIDGSPEFLKTLRNQQLQAENDEVLGTKVLMSIIDKLAPHVSGDLYSKLCKCKSWEEKLDTYMKYLPKDIVKISQETQWNITISLYHRMLAVGYYDTSKIPLIRADITLLKPTIQSFRNLEADYGLSKITKGKVKIFTLEGNHATILNNPKIAAVINGDIFEESAV